MVLRWEKEQPRSKRLPASVILIGDNEGQRQVRLYWDGTFPCTVWRGSIEGVREYFLLGESEDFPGKAFPQAGRSSVSIEPTLGLTCTGRRRGETGCESLRSVPLTVCRMANGQPLNDIDVIEGANSPHRYPGAWSTKYAEMMCRWCAFAENSSKSSRWRSCAFPFRC